MAWMQTIYLALDITAGSRQLMKEKRYAARRTAAYSKNGRLPQRM